jgi:hypothetical protein
MGNGNISAKPLKSAASPSDPVDAELHNVTFDLLSEDLAITLTEKNFNRPYYGNIYVPSDFGEDTIAPKANPKNPIKGLFKG